MSIANAAVQGKAYQADGAFRQDASASDFSYTKATMPAITNVLETCLYADDLGAAEAFYRDVLGLTPYAKAEGRHVFFKLPTGMLLVFDAEAAAAEGALPPHGTSGRGHCCFQIAEEDLDAWRDRLERRGVEITCEHAWPNGATSLYFCDPAGNVLELAPARLWEAS